MKIGDRVVACSPMLSDPRMGTVTLLSEDTANVLLDGNDYVTAFLRDYLVSFKYWEVVRDMLNALKLPIEWIRDGFSMYHATYRGYSLRLFATSDKAGNTWHLRFANNPSNNTGYAAYRNLGSFDTVAQAQDAALQAIDFYLR